LRRRILLAFERAESEPDADERRRLLNFVVVGGGPTGVEMAGAIAELAKRALAADFRSIDPSSARIILIEAGTRLLAAFSPALSENARRSLEQLGVEVRLGARVTDCDCSGVSLDSERLQTRTIVWAAGVKASPVAEWLGAASDRAGRLKVKTDLSAKPSKYFRDRRCRCCHRTGWQAVAWRRARRQAARSVCRKFAGGAHPWQNPAAISLSRPRIDGHDWSQARGRTDRSFQSFRACRMVVMEPRSHLFPDRLPQSTRCGDELVLELRDISAWYTSDNRHPGLTHRRRDRGGYCRPTFDSSCRNFRLYALQGFPS